MVLFITPPPTSPPARASSKPFATTSPLAQLPSMVEPFIEPTRPPAMCTS